MSFEHFYVCLHSLQLCYKPLPFVVYLNVLCLCTHSYLILAPTIMYAEKEPKNAAAKCFESIGLDPDSYRIGHTKARKIY